MKLSGTLSLYIGRNFLLSFLAFFVGLLTLVFLLDFIELLRRASSKPEVTFWIISQMALLKLPHMGQLLFPFAALFGGMSAFWRLSRSQELAVTRAAGISVWQFILPALILAMALGVFKIAAFNPLSSATLSRFQTMEAIFLKGQKSVLAISDNGLWLRQGTAEGHAVVHAINLLQQGDQVTLQHTITYLFQGQDTFIGRIDAERAVLGDGFWRMENAWVNSPEAPPEHLSEYWLETDLTLTKIQDNFAAPETMSFWKLPEFIKTLEEAGFSAIRHRLQWHSLLATPLLMCAMVLIAATFTLRHARRGATTFVIASGVFTGFILYFFSDVVFALGLSDSIPVTLAAWAPSGVASMLGLAMLFHLEDG
ncbi:LPS export ABC transporter permease LptG [Magnetovibrio blakemorei]|uniref:LPS export ABC transporter permease LptG n=1 Tax=Magnetovibrio blakemorei TaxID=28181 RepID=A0A1E5Q9X3_9PROT|nr:LPS export ABC transporter permease LptG [Magnetovibrio blakemorei]OEJ68533.1 LPS export ABC transporter permease LptG [Magnetovibrio blakemorei]